MNILERKPCNVHAIPGDTFNINYRDGDGNEQLLNTYIIDKVMKIVETIIFETEFEGRQMLAGGLIYE